MLVPNRYGSSENYRYGFNGKEKDDEFKGEGNSYDFGARILDPRVGRWFATDKFEGKYPSFSPYVAFIDNPIFFVDPDGNDIEPWKWRWNILGVRFGPYYSLSSHYNSDVKFDKTYQKMIGSSGIFKRIISQLEGSSRTYKFSSTYHSSRSRNNTDRGGHFDPNHRGTKDDPYTINFMIDYKSKTTTADNVAVIFEETFHAAQHEFALEKNYKISYLAREVEAKLAKNIEAFTSKEEAYSYEVMKFEGSDEIFSALRSRRKLTDVQKTKLGKAIFELSKSVSEVYGRDNDRFEMSTLVPEIDFDFIESLYGQDISNKLPTIVIDKESKK